MRRVARNEGRYVPEKAKRTQPQPLRVSRRKLTPARVWLVRQIVCPGLDSTVCPTNRSSVSSPDCTGSRAAIGRVLCDASTQQAAILYFFSPYGDEAAILAFGLTFPVALILFRCVLGLRYLSDLPKLRRAVAGAGHGRKAR